MKKTFEVTIHRTVEVHFDEEKMTKEVQDIFSQTMWKVKDIAEIIKHIARMVAMDDHYIGSDHFIEGLGPARDFGITADVTDEDEEIEEEK